ncbi:hypothetical protein PPYR_06383 [Photinus pyralis]|uniref:Medium-chain acyl-CoA ligase ACSF2, mitochondrial n=1 Tax=Photinus pyralis TaxID=7054 RepID=A0A5N4ATQ5_PHOPY|nr:hypothetical protein PPYR_06383 [Photinus pyralis]
MQAIENDQESDTLSRKTGLSYLHNPGSEPLRYMTLSNLLESAAARYGQTEAFVSLYDNRRVTYTELHRDADQLASGFRRLGLGRGDRIGLWAPNGIEWVTTMYAAARVGLITVCLNPGYEANELKYCLNKCGVKALVCPDVYRTLDFYGKLCTLIPDLSSGNVEVPTLKTIIMISQQKLRGTFNYCEVLGMADETGIEQQSKVSPDDICNIQFSSGTTGLPKAACLTHFQILNVAYFVGKRMNLDESQQKFCLQLPLFHVFGVVGEIAMGTHFGKTMVFPSPTYNSTANLNALEQERCSIVFGTPTMYVDLINLQKKSNKKIWVTDAVIGGSPCSPSIINAIKDHLKIQNIVYGATEMTGITFQSLIDDKEYRNTETVGYIMDHVEAKVVDRKGNLVPFGTPGELCVRGYLISKSYWNDPEKTKEVLCDRKWYRTGDEFVLQEDGYGRVVGRLKDMIIRGGENIFPKEIEDLLGEHPDILEIFVIGVNSERLGEEVCACVRPKPGSQVTLDSIREFCRGKLAPYKIPSHLEIVATFPKTASGKIQKYLLKEQIC